MLLDPGLFGFPPYGAELERAEIPRLKQRVVDELKAEGIDTELPFIVEISHSNQKREVTGYVFNSPRFDDGAIITAFLVETVKGAGTPGVYKMVSGIDPFIVIGPLFNWKN